jgi:hypothetical protein
MARKVIVNKSGKEPSEWYNKKFWCVIWDFIRDFLLRIFVKNI